MSDYEKIREELDNLLKSWKAQEKIFGETLQIGRCGDNDGSFNHGRYDMLQECIIDLDNVLDWMGR